MTDTPPLKQEMRRLLAAGETREALNRLLDYTEQTGALPLHNEAVLQSARFAQYEKDRNSGAEDYDSLLRSQIKTQQALLDIIDKLPEKGEKEKKPRLRGISERALKNHVLWIMLIEKVLLVVFVFTLWESGAFTAEQFVNTIGLLAPLFAAYLTLMIKDAAKHRHLDTPLDQQLLVRRSFQWMTYMLLAIYFFAIVIIINLRGMGLLSEFGQMTALLATMESALGVYVGAIVFALFKKDEL